MAFQFTDANFGEAVAANQDGVTMVDFWAEWCGPCRMVGPHVEALADDYAGKALIGKCDVDNNPEVAMAFQVRSIPLIVFIKNGKIVDKQLGATSKEELKKKLDAAIKMEVPA